MVNADLVFWMTLRHMVLSLVFNKKVKGVFQKNDFLYWGETQNSLRYIHSPDVTVCWCYMYVYVQYVVSGDLWLCWVGCSVVLCQCYFLQGGPCWPGSLDYPGGPLSPCPSCQVVAYACWANTAGFTALPLFQLRIICPSKSALHLGHVKRRPGLSCVFIK